MSLNNDPIQKYLKAQSTHQSIQDRLSVYNKLGLNKPGFWVGWKQRNLNAQVGDEDMPTAAQNPVIKTLNPYDTQATNYTTDPPIKRDPIKPLQMPTMLAQGQAPDYIHGTLQQLEKESFWRDLVVRTRQNPLISTDLMDVLTMEKIYQNYDVVKQMNADPTLFASAALIKYFNQKRQQEISDWQSNATNFEKIVAISSTMKKKNLKITGRFIGPTEDQKNVAKQSRLQQTRGGGPVNPMNVKMGGYYAPPLYMSPFG